MWYEKKIFKYSKADLKMKSVQEEAKLFYKRLHHSCKKLAVSTNPGDPPRCMHYILMFFWKNYPYCAITQWCVKNKVLFCKKYKISIHFTKRIIK